MNKSMDEKYLIKNDLNRDSTSSQDSRKINYSFIDNSEKQMINQSEYLNLLSKNTDVFTKILPDIKEIKAEILRNYLISFVSVFTEVLSSLQTVTNNLPALNMEQEEDSIFLEWIFKDFRTGFTFSKEESESMWFILTNKNLEELCVTGDLNPKDYKPIIIKILKYVLENT